LAVAEYWWEQQGWSSDLAPYAILGRALLEQRLTAAEFETMFLTLYKRDPTPWPPATFHVLDRLFADVDSYHPDAAIRAQTNGIDETELRTRAAAAFEQLRRR